MFWTLHDTTYPIDNLLNNPDVNITQLLDEHHVLQKCRGQDPQLLNFLCRQDNLSYLVDQLCTPPVNTDEKFDQNLYRYPNLACEILTCGIDVLTDGLLRTDEPQPKSKNQLLMDEEEEEQQQDSCMDIIMVDSPKPRCSMLLGSVDTSTPSENQKISDSDMDVCEASTSCPSAESVAPPRIHLDRLLGAIDAPLNPLSFSFLSRVLVYLATSRSDFVLAHVRNYPNLLDRILSRFNTTVMPDFVLQLIKCGSPLVFQWFLDDRLVQHLIDNLSPTTSWEVHESVSRCLIQMLKLMRSHFVDHTDHSKSSEDDETVDCGLPPTSPYAGLVSVDHPTLHPSALQLLDVLESEQTIKSIMNKVINDETSTTSVITNSVDFLLALLDKQKLESTSGVDQPDSMNDIGFLGSALGAFMRPMVVKRPNPQLDQRFDRVRSTFASLSLPLLSALQTLLKQPHSIAHGSPVIGGESVVPFGHRRFSLVQLVKLLSSLPVETNVPKVLVDLGFVSTLMELFEEHPFHTLYHQLFVDIVRCLFDQADLLHRPDEPFASSSNGTELNESRSNPSTPVHKAEDTAVGEDHLLSLDKDTLFGFTKLDEAIRTIFKSNRFVHWCLRLNPLPSDLSFKSDTSALHASRKHPKPGYTGHLWQLANLLQEARNGPRQDFMRRLFEDLDADTVAKWDSFVADQLTVINSQHIPDEVSSNLPISAGCNTNPSNHNEQAGFPIIFNSLSGLIRNLADTDGLVGADWFSLGSGLHAQGRLSFQPNRIASFCSDEGDSDDAKHGDSDDNEDDGDDGDEDQEEDNDDDEDDYEEESENVGDVVWSPRLVIHQQRSTTSQVPTIIGSTGAAYSWNMKPSATCLEDASDPWSATADVSHIQMSSEQTAWAAFDQPSNHEDSTNGELNLVPYEGGSSEVSSLSDSQHPTKSPSSTTTSDPPTMSLP